MIIKIVAITFALRAKLFSVIPERHQYSSSEQAGAVAVLELVAKFLQLPEQAEFDL